MKKLRRVVLWIIALISFVYVTVACIKIGPSNLWGMLWYDQRREGHLKVGDLAPNAILLALDGKTKVKLSDYMGKKPLVLIFGSYT